MSFYGDIKRVQSSPFVFDKYYPNRLTMDSSCASDNVYIGRYVLVKYTVKDEQDTSTSSPYFDKYVLADEVIPQGETTTSTTTKKVFQGYQFNAEKDINQYNDTFDGTVWQKIYTNTAAGEQLEKYILVAELNASVPRIGLDIISPKKTDGTYNDQKELNEKWNEPSVVPSLETEDEYRFRMPNVLHLDVGSMGENFYAKQLIDPAYRWRMTTDTAEDGTACSTNPNIAAGGGGSAENAISHEDMLSPNYNYMTWKNYRLENEKMVEAIGEGPIDGKKLDTKLYAFGQLISDLYDALYGVPLRDDGLRPFYTDKLQDVISNYDKGLIGVLTSIATDMKGDSSQDLYGRTLIPGMYYYFTSSWNDATENPDSFIENIPRVIGSAADLNENKCHYKINFDLHSNNDSNLRQFVNEITSDTENYLKTTVD